MGFRVVQPYNHILHHHSDCCDLDLAAVVSCWMLATPYCCLPLLSMLGYVWLAVGPGESLIVFYVWPWFFKDKWVRIINKGSLVYIFSNGQPWKPHRKNLVHVHLAPVELKYFSNSTDCIFCWVHVFWLSTVGLLNNLTTSQCRNKTITRYHNITILQYHNFTIL